MRFLESILKRLVLGFQCLELGGDFADGWAFGKKVWNV
jgi:hypothetical protein